MTSSAIPTGMRTARPTSSTATRRTSCSERDFGYSIGGPIGKPGRQQQAVLLLQPRIRAAHAGRQPQPVPGADGARAGRRLLADARQQRRPLQPDQGSAVDARACTAANTAGCFQDGGVLGKIPANRFYSLGQAILNQYPLPNISGAGLAYNYETAQPTEKALAWQPAVRVDYQPSTNLRMTYKYSGWTQSDKSFLGTMPTITESRLYKPDRLDDGDVGQLHVQPLDVPRGDVRPQPERAGRVRPGQGGTGPPSARAPFPTALVQPRSTPGSAACRCCSRMR